MTTQDALTALAGATAAAVADALRELTGAEVGEPVVTLPAAGRDPFDAVGVPAVVATADYAGGVQGGSVLVLGAAVARRLPGCDPEAGLDDQLPELTEALERVMAAATAATGAALGEDVATEPLAVEVATGRGDVKAAAAGATRPAGAIIEVDGEPCHLVLLVPTVFTMRLTQTLAHEPGETVDPAAAAAMRAALGDVPLRVWAELGRARLRTVDVAALGDGSIVDLDHAAEDPVDIFVNGSRIATGRLIRLEESDWAVRLEEVFPLAEPDSTLLADA